MDWKEVSCMRVREITAEKLPAGETHICQRCHASTKGNGIDTPFADAMYCITIENVVALDLCSVCIKALRETIENMEEGINESDKGNESSYEVLRKRLRRELQHMPALP